MSTDKLTQPINLMNQTNKGESKIGILHMNITDVFKLPSIYDLLHMEQNMNTNTTYNMNTDIDGIYRTLTQKQRNMLFRYNVFITITFNDIKYNKVYYTVCFGIGNSDDSIGVNNVIPTEMYKIELRFSELRQMNVNIANFPYRTLFNHTDAAFVRNRVNDLNKWIDSTLENNEGINLFSKLKDVYKSKTLF